MIKIVSRRPEGMDYECIIKFLWKAAECMLLMHFYVSVDLSFGVNSVNETICQPDNVISLFSRICALHNPFGKTEQY